MNAPALMAAAIMVILWALSSCVPASEVQRNTCHGLALGEAQARAVRQCPHTWDTCDHRAAIESDLEKALKECDK